MRLHLKVLVVFAAAWLASAGIGEAATLSRACAYLWAQQSADGGWHSRTYGLMRSGQALTPFVLQALLAAPRADCAAPPEGVERALAFIRRHVNDGGQVGADDPDVLEYPNYATAYALRCLIRAGRPDDHALVARMRARLVAEQFTPASGFGESSLAFGGWGFGGTRTPQHPGHMDLSHTRKVLQALREAGAVDAHVFARARIFLRLMQRHPSETRPHPAPLLATALPPRAPRFDGGFFFSPIVLDANKGQVLADARGPFHGSYATATCDGLLALLAAGVPPRDARVQAARRWLFRDEALDRPEGVPDSPQAWDQALDFYALAVRAEAYAALGERARLASRLLARLAPQQRADGSFVNERNHLMKEDDPLLATTLAVVALT